MEAGRKRFAVGELYSAFAASIFWMHLDAVRPLLGCDSKGLSKCSPLLMQLTIII